MATDFVPQFKPEELYISPFKAVRYYEGATAKPHYRPLERNMSPTGVHLLDEFLRIVCTSGNYTLRSLELRLGGDIRDFSAMCRLLTGLSFSELHDVLRLRLADDLLRYTDFEVKEIAKYCGFANYSAMFKLFERTYKYAPGVRRLKLRRSGDLGAKVIEIPNK